MDEPRLHRLFFALWPNQAIRQQISDGFQRSPQSKLRGRPMLPSNLHITLHFIGNADEDYKNCLDGAAKTVKGERFSLILDRYGHFYKPRVFWMGCQHSPKALLDLHQSLGQALMECGYTIESRPYAPHVSLMRKLVKPGDFEEFQPITWQIDDFVLVKSSPIEDGVQYEVVERYPLVS